MHTTDLVPQVVKVPVQAAFDGALLGRRLAIPVRRGVERKGYAVDGARGAGAPVCVGVALQQGGERAGDLVVEGFAGACFWMGGFD